MEQRIAYALGRWGRIAALLGAFIAQSAVAETIITRPYEGVTYIVRTEGEPRALTMHIALIDLTAPGISFAVTPHSGTRETTRQTTADFVRQQQAQLGINVAFFDPVTVPASADPEAFLGGLHVSKGEVVSSFDPQPAPGFGPNQSYAIVSYAPALNIDQNNRAAIVHRDPAQAGNQAIQENQTLWNAVSGSAQIITNGEITVPLYKDAEHPDGLLTPGGTANYSNANSWYNLLNARTAIGMPRDGRTLVLFTVDRGTNSGMTVGEVARLLKEEYDCFQALNLDGGGSTSMALRDPETGVVQMVNRSSDANYAEGRPAGANLAVFAPRLPNPAVLTQPQPTTAMVPQSQPDPVTIIGTMAGLAILLAIWTGAARRKE